MNPRNSYRPGITPKVERRAVSANGLRIRLQFGVVTIAQAVVVIRVVGPGSLALPQILFARLAGCIRRRCGGRLLTALLSLDGSERKNVADRYADQAGQKGQGHWLQARAGKHGYGYLSQWKRMNGGVSMLGCQGGLVCRENSSFLVGKTRQERRHSPPRLAPLRDIRAGKRASLGRLQPGSPENATFRPRLPQAASSFTQGKIRLHPSN